MSFNASTAYGQAFDSQEWKPYGMPDAVSADEGFQSFVNDPLKAQEMEMQFAGDALGSWAATRQGILNSNQQVKNQKILSAASPPSQGGGSGIGQALGIAGKVLPMIAGLCDMRVKEDVSPMFTIGQVNDKLASMALSVHHLRDVCS